MMNSVSLSTPELQALEAAAQAGEGRVSTVPHRLSIVVPMYNEVQNAVPMIDAVQDALAAYPWPWELIVVDDGSADGTGQALDRRARELGPHIRILHLARNFRQTAAMQRIPRRHAGRPWYVEAGRILDKVELARSSG